MRKPSAREVRRPAPRPRRLRRQRKVMPLTSLKEGMAMRKKPKALKFP
jgi:hypothetical protein